jgi:hypothetical protein
MEPNDSWLGTDEKFLLGRNPNGSHSRRRPRKRLKKKRSKSIRLNRPNLSLQSIAGNRRIKVSAGIFLLSISIAGLSAEELHSLTPQTTVLIAKTTIPAGTKLTYYNTSAENVPVTSLDRSLVGPTILATKVSTYARSTIVAGNPILKSQLGTEQSAPTGTLMVITVKPDLISRQIVTPGSRVDVLATYDQSGNPVTETLAASVPVISVAMGTTNYRVLVNVSHLETALAIAQAMQVASIDLVSGSSKQTGSPLQSYPPLPVGGVNQNG